jgi:6-phosphogluconolactonase (cycloisomerase 2 family)
MHAAENTFSSGSTVFVMTNDTGKNEVLAYQRLIDGTFILKGRFATGGRGSGGTADPLQSQGSLTLSQDSSLLFAVNAGSGTISSFHLLGGIPVLTDQEPTGGAFPVAVAEHNHVVYVLDAGGNGAIVPFRADILGRLHQISEDTVYLTAANDGASAISVSPDGKTLVVIEKEPNQIDTYPINPDGTLGQVVINKSITSGVFATVFAPNGALIVSENQPGGTDISSISSYAVNPGGTITAITQSIPSEGDGNCWNAITPNGKFVYVDNAGTGTIAGFSVGANGSLTPIGGTIVATYPSDATNLDMSISGDGQYLYTLNSGLGTVGVFHINSDGTLTQLDDIPRLPKGVGFNGIAAL